MTVILNADDWTDWVLDTVYTPPVFPTLAELRALSPKARAKVQERRQAHNAREVNVRTDLAQNISTMVRRRHLLNQHGGPRARYGFVLSGAPRTGKTTLLQWFGKDYELMLRARDPERFVDRGGPRPTPVVYLTLPQGANEKTMSKAFADYLNVPCDRRDNEQEITRKVHAALKAMQTEFLLIDEVHNIARTGTTRSRWRAGRLANDYLKHFCNQSAATPFFAGVNLERSGLFSEFDGNDRYTQTAGRFTLVRLDPFASPREPQGRALWQSLVLTLESNLHLYQHQRGDLVALANYLHDRTGGFIGTLSQIIRESAVLAIDNGSERIDQRLLDQVLVDKQSTDAYHDAVRDAQARTVRQAAATTRKSPRTRSVRAPAAT